jgi:hypothetical protein
MDKLQLTVDEKGKVYIEMDGYELTGVRAIEFRWEAGELPTHNIEFVTHVARFK